MATPARALGWILAALSAIGLAAAPAAAEFPDRVVTIIVPYAAGGPSDTVGRILAEAMGAKLGQQVIVENVGGASGTLGAARVAKAEADGYTLLLHTSAHATNSLLYRKLAYGSHENFAPVGVATTTPMILVGRQDLPPATASEVFDYIRANKDQVTYGHAGIGGPSHLCGMLLMSKLDSQITTVPYKGTGPAMTDLLGGQIDLLCDQATSTLPQIRGGKVKAYAVAAPQRLPELPELPTMAEAGLAGFETTVWLGLYAPKDTPAEVVGKLSATLQASLAMPEVSSRLRDLETSVASPEAATPDGLRQALAAETAKWEPLIKAAGVYAD